MKKFIALLLVLMMAVPAFAMTAGTYEGEAMGKMGNVKVSVVVTENAIESVTVVSHNETEGYFKPVEETIPAAIVEKQSLLVDVVTGSTLSSNAIINATEAALIAAGADVEAFKVAEIVADPAETFE